MKNNKEIKFQLKTISLYYSISTLFIEILSYPLIEFGLVEHLIDESDEIKEKKKINEHLKGKNLLAWLDWYDKKNVSNFHQNKEIEQFIDYETKLA